MRNRLVLVALVVALLLSMMAAGLLEAFAGGRVLWSYHCPLNAEVVVIDNVIRAHIVQCVIGDDS